MVSDRLVSLLLSFWKNILALMVHCVTQFTRKATIGRLISASWLPLGSPRLEELYGSQQLQSKEFIPFRRPIPPSWLPYDTYLDSLFVACWLFLS